MSDLTLGATHRTLRDEVTNELRRRILSGELPPGERLVEDRLAASLGVSRNPVRESIRVLATEGFVEVVPRLGATVSRLSAEEGEELFDVRMAVEGLAARLAARKRTAASAARLRQVLDHARQAVDEGRLEEVADLNTAFHLAVVEAAGNSYLSLMMKPMLLRAQWVFSRTAAARGPHSWSEHVSLCEAIAAGDEDEAQARAVAHVAAARRSFLTAVRRAKAPND
ncbi:FCD domain-containing protein [Nonomuraea phyllanthi]|uniref:FCD domain-containing protein n=1 Tax=Nonomuraea phyllanthi TaxID=2219224 RepID=A0A5C4WQ86_9ACTN|nr:GntR family transcriptional regulator [Nonomuraea phyllanthi]KAB8195686.1 FCD domain-containing protein [Nonomuraea phyllanthi]QFY07129.1 FCD domain-containing protein [Nonomuraea phyllanthi]